MKAVALHMLMIFALVSAAISPACAAMQGGQHWTQICNALGEVSVIALDQDGNAISGEQTAQRDNVNKLKASCDNCLFSNDLLAIIAPAAPYRAVTRANLRLSDNSKPSTIRFDFNHYQSRAPPYFL